MIAAAGTLNLLVQFLRRGAGGYASLGDGQWARLEFERPATVDVAGVSLQGRAGRLTVRSNEISRGLKPGDRLTLDEDIFTITIRKAPEITSDDVHLEIVSAPSSTLYAAEMDRRGQIVVLQRSNEEGGWDRCEARAIVAGFTADELVGDIDQGTRKIWLLAADVDGSAFPAPPEKNDIIKVRGNPLNVMSVDADTHRVGDELFAYLIVAKGA